MSVSPLSLHNLSATFHVRFLLPLLVGFEWRMARFTACFSFPFFLSQPCTQLVPRNIFLRIAKHLQNQLGYIWKQTSIHLFSYCWLAKKKKIFFLCTLLFLISCLWFTVFCCLQFVAIPLTATCDSAKSCPHYKSFSGQPQNFGEIGTQWTIYSGYVHLLKKI